MAATSRTTSDAKPSLRVQVRRVFDAPPERVFRAWTTPDELTRWHAPAGMTCYLAEVDLRVGGRYRIGMRDPSGGEHVTVGTYRVIDPPRRLAFSWRFETTEDHAGNGETLVTIECIPSGTGTELVLTHEGFLNEDARTAHEHGWTEIVEKLGQTY
jgi:uncharacterized protein YndB with AHSA1/START domain